LAQLARGGYIKKIHHLNGQRRRFRELMIAGKLYSEKLTGDCNHHLKNAVKQAAETAIMAKDNPFRRKYLDMTLLHGCASYRAKLTIARDILAIMYSMWKTGEKYNPERRKN
jgi:hypothetical protein